MAARLNLEADKNPNVEETSPDLEPQSMDEIYQQLAAEDREMEVVQTEFLASRKRTRDLEEDENMHFALWERSARPLTAKEKDYHWQIKNFRRGGLNAWRRYQTLSGYQKSIALKVQSMIIYMFDTYRGFESINDDGEEMRWEDSLIDFKAYFVQTLNEWNPQMGEDRHFGILDPYIGMVANSERILEIMDTNCWDFFEYVVSNIDTVKVFDVLKVACTLGQWLQWVPSQSIPQSTWNLSINNEAISM